MKRFDASLSEIEEDVLGDFLEVNELLRHLHQRIDQLRKEAGKEFTDTIVAALQRGRADELAALVKEIKEGS